MIKLLAKLLRVLNSETDPGQISLGLCFAMVAGLTPLLSLHNLVVLLLVLVLRVNLSAFLLGLALFTGIAYLLDPLFHSLGLAILTAPALQELWTALYQSIWWRIERFHNSIVMGSLTFSLVLFVQLSNSHPLIHLRFQIPEQFHILVRIQTIPINSPSW
ncbi:MAG: TIGR03546 family protein, partial [Nitrospirales bacterium]